MAHTLFCAVIISSEFNYSCTELFLILLTTPWKLLQDPRGLLGPRFEHLDVNTVLLITHVVCTLANAASFLAHISLLA